MSGRAGGQRALPRVAVLGNFEQEDLTCFERMFPTIWKAENIIEMKRKVDKREIDLLIIAPCQDQVSDWPYGMHVICFSSDVHNLPGPVEGSFVSRNGIAETEGYVFCEVNLPLDHCRATCLPNLTSVRFWPRLTLSFNVNVETDARSLAERIFDAGALIRESVTQNVLAVAFLRERSRLGFAWFPSPSTNMAGMVEVLVTEWAQMDPDRFPGFGNWQNSPEWLVAEEEHILSLIAETEEKKKIQAAHADKQIAGLVEKLSVAKTAANSGRRRLVTTQGSELVDEVAKSFARIGFAVSNMDQTIGNSGMKKEDLRLSHSDKEGKQWNAIVEVRGYTKSGGTTGDLQRLGRFAELYRKETGDLPDKRIYVVNGQLELLPNQRRAPLESAPEDIAVFAESDGIVIWSLDLFRAMKGASPYDYPTLLESIKNVHGRWLPPAGGV